MFKKPSKLFQGALAVILKTVCLVTVDCYCNINSIVWDWYAKVFGARIFHKYSFLSARWMGKAFGIDNFFKDLLLPKDIYSVFWLYRFFQLTSEVSCVNLVFRKSAGEWEAGTKPTK